MLKLRDEFTYIENYTITGKKLLVGIREQNSYIMIKKSYHDIFYTLLERLNSNNDLSELNLCPKEKELVDAFNRKGYFKNNEEIKKSFNEYNSLVKIIKRIDIGKIKIKSLSCKTSFYILYFLAWLIGIIFIINNRHYLNQTINFSDFTITEILVCLIILPILIDFSHEFGHFILAKLLGVNVGNLTIGFFVTWPTIYIQYKGLNLYHTKDKLCITSAGVFVHIINVILGLIIQQLGFHNNIVLIWIIANIGMVSTNLLFFGPSDGYFMLTSILGIYNLRYRGYITINHILKGNKDKININYLCALIVMGCWLFSFWGIYITLNYYGRIFSINRYIVFTVSLILIIFLFVRLIRNIKNIDAYRYEQ